MAESNGQPDRRYGGTSGNGSANGDPDRNDKGQFVPGNSFAPKPGEVRNPLGRPKGRSITEEIRKLLNEGMTVDGTKRDVARAIAEAAVKFALSGKFPYFKEIMDRNDGPVEEHVAVRHSIEDLDETERATVQAIIDRYGADRFRDGD